DPETMVEGHTVLSALLGRGGEAAPAIQQLLRHGASPAGAGGLARFLAACVQRDEAARGHEQLALDLFAAGADPFLPSPAGAPPACAGGRAAARGPTGWGRALRSAAAPPSPPWPAAAPPLALAVRLGWLRLLDALLDAGVDREARDSHGMTALHLAAALGR